MILKVKYCLSILLTASLFISSCKKETSCEGCKELNQPPIAIAGPDQVITLPTDSILLDGRNSSDPDGTISVWLWTKISGPASFTIDRSTDSITIVRNLITGTFQFELKVTDKAGQSAKDTVQVIVNDPSQPNRPPIANAGTDQTINLPVNSVTVNGSGSTDPDNNITNYAWSKISGPSSFNIANASAIQTPILNLIEGAYQFELKVTDAGGLFASDTIQITVNAATLPPSPCNNSWQTVNATFAQIATLSESRSPVAMSAGNKVVFAGGWKYGLCGFSCDEADFGSAVVDIFDMPSQSWSTTQLSKARGNIAAVSSGNKIFFAGGYSWECNLSGLSLHVSYDNVDIYDVSANSWQVAHLSKARSDIAVAAVGSKILFAGGYFFTGDPFGQVVWSVTDRVDIYDMATGQWSTASLSSPAMNVIANRADDKVYFDFGNGIIDIFNNADNTWTTSDLQTVIASLSPPPAMGNVDQFASMGDNIVFWNSQHKAGIRNLVTGLTSVVCLPHPEPVCIVNNNIIFWEDATHFNIYNTITGSLSEGLSNPAISSNAGSWPRVISSVNNIIYFGGGGACPGYSNIVYKLTW
jgi:hypothetical protein